MKRWMSGMCVMALLGLMAAPAVGQNLLQNPSFEDDAAPNDHVPDGWTLTGAMAYKEPGDNYFNVPARTGDDRIGSESDSSTASGSAAQSVGLPNGASGYDLTLSFYAAFHIIGGTENSATGEIVVDGQVVASATVSATTDQAYSEGTVSWAGIALTDIAVRLSVDVDGTAGWGVVGIDDVSLTEAAACENQHTTSSVDPPASNDNNSDAIDVTINGTNLDQVTGVKLVMGATEVVGTGLTPAGDGLSMTVDFPTTNAEAGVYNVVTDQTDCLSRVLVDAFTVICPDASVPTAASPNSFTIPPVLGTAEPITISGTAYLDSVATVSLVHETGAPAITGIIGTKTETQIDATFDLSTAAVGLYDVVCDRDDGCPDAVLEDEIQISVVGTNLILNGGFDVVAGSENPDFPNGLVNARIWLADYNVYGLPNLECLYPACEEGVDPDTWCYQDCEDVEGCVEPDEDPTCCDAREGGCLNPCCCTDPCEEAYGGWGSRSHRIGPLGVAPEWQAWELAIGGDEGTTQTWQTVAVSTGASVVFYGHVHTGPFGTAEGVTNEVTITLYDGAGVGGTPLDTVTIDETVAAGPAWRGVTLSALAGVRTSPYVTVEFTTDVVGTSHNAGAVHCEEFSLLSGVECTTQHTVTNMNPRYCYHDEDKSSIYIYGSNMDHVTGVKLIQVESQTIVEAPIGLQASGYVGITVPALTARAPLGFYTVLTEQEDCVGETDVDGFEIRCHNPSVFTGVEPSILESPQQEPVVFRVSGTGLVDAGQSELDSVSLAMGNTVLTDDSPTPAGEDLLITLDLSTAPGGFYTLKGTRPDDQCFDPDPLPSAFELVSPCDNLLSNGDFELGPGKEWNEETQTWEFIRADLLPADGWTQIPGGDGQPKYNEFVQGPPDFIPGNAEDDCPEGDNYGSVHTGNGDVSRMIQVVDRPLDIYAGMELGLRGWIYGCSEADPDYVDRNFAHRARLWDGTDTDPGTGTVLAEFVMAEEDHCGLWVPFSVIGAPTTGSVVTVEWGYERGADPHWAIPATHVDDLKLCPPVSCNDPFADFDDDDDVDQDDFGVMQKCMGHGILPGCDCADADHDGNVTETDYNAFEACASGPDVDADTTCDDPA